MAVHGVLGPASRGVPRSIPLATPTSYVTNGRATLPALSVSAARVGARPASALQLPRITSFGARIVMRNASGRATLPAITVAGARVGVRRDTPISLPLITAHGVSFVTHVAVGRATLPPFSTAFIRGRATLPLITAAGRSSKVQVLTKVAWVTNLDIGETTQFTNFDFLHIIRLGNTVYGVKADGLYALGGATDAGAAIAASFTTQPTDFGMAVQKYVPQMWVGAEQAVTVTTIVDEVAIGSYSTDISRAKTQRVPLSRGDRGRYWSFTYSNVSGGAFRINAVEPQVQPTSMRV